MATPVEVRAVASRSDLDQFIKLPWHIYEHDPNWVAPLIVEVRKVLDREHHPFHRHAQVEYFLARRGKKVVGRIAAIVNHQYNDFHGEKTGFFGLFESVDDEEVASALLAAAETWLRGEGMVRCLGPMNLSTNDELFSPGILIDGFDTPPAILMGHNLPYYARLVERYGYHKTKDLLAYWMEANQTPDRLVRSMARLQRNANVTIRPISVRDFDAEVARIKAIYNSAWERNWGFVPMTDAEFDYMAKSLRPIIDPRFILIAESEGKPIGFAIELVDLNQPLKKVNGRLFPFGVFKFLYYKRKITSIRVLTLGLVPEWRGRGIDSMMIVKLMEASQPSGLARGECSWILEDNLPMRNWLERTGAHVYKTYRVYSKTL